MRTAAYYECGCPSAGDPLSLRESNADVLRPPLLPLAPAACEDSMSGGEDDQPAAAVRHASRVYAATTGRVGAARPQQHVLVPETLEDALALVDALATMRKTADADDSAATELVVAVLGNGTEAMTDMTSGRASSTEIIEMAAAATARA